MRRRSALVGCTVVVAGAAVGCWPGWQSILDTTPSTEHIVEDLRVLAIQTDPPGLVLLAPLESGPAERTLRVRPFVVDPRAGEVEVTVSLGKDQQLGGEGIFDVGIRAPRQILSVPAQHFVVRAPGKDEDGFGATEPIEAIFTIGGDAIAELFTADDVSDPGLVPARLYAVVKVRREVGFTVETETAFSVVDVRLNPDPALWGPDERSDALLEVNAVDCPDEADRDACVPGGGGGGRPPPEEIFEGCGDGIVNGDEICDPPDGLTCPDNCGSACGDGERTVDEECDYTVDTGCAFDCKFDPCNGGDFPSPPLCIQYPSTGRLAENALPTILGLAIDFDASLAVAGPADVDVAPGGTLPLRAGRSVLVVPVVDDPQRDTGQPFPTNGFTNTCALPIAGCGLGAPSDFATPAQRFYVADDGTTLALPFDFGGGLGGVPPPVNSGGFLGQGVLVALPDDAQSGSIRPLVVVATDGQGGMATARFDVVVE